MPRSQRVRHFKHRLAFKRSILTVAIAQLESPLPRGKHPSVVAGRESYEWISLEAMSTRRDKALAVLDSLVSIGHLDLLVFPEYSIPAKEMVPIFQQRADEHNCIIVGGADSIRQPSNKIYNQCPIIIPGHRSPIWVTKRELSQWEHGYVDQPDSVSLPLLLWEAAGQTYWLSIHICMDFLLVPRDRTDYHSAPGLYIVPMCSPELNTFRVYADTLLRTEAGTGTILCNCTGELAEGRSSLITVTPSGKRLQPAVELPDHKEAVGVFELDMRRLAPPKKSVPSVNPAVGKRQKYSLQAATEGVRLISSGSQQEDQEVTTRAVINPAVFQRLGKKMRLAFLAVDKYAALSERLADQRGFEVLAVLGQHDVLITHLDQDRYDMIYDITQVIPIRTDLGPYILPGSPVDHQVHETFPFFRVDVYFKVLGVPVGPLERAILDDPERPVPTEEELAQIVALCSNWYDESIPDDAKAKFQRRKWILANTSRQPGDIGAVMTIFLEHTGAHEALALHQASFEDTVINALVRRQECTSIYRGRAQSLSIHYVIRITSEVKSLFNLIEDVHKLAQEARVIISTNTYVVMKKLASLSLERSLLLPPLPPEMEHFLKHQLLPRLSVADRAHVRYMPHEELRRFVKRYQETQEAIADLDDIAWLRQRIDEIERKLATGLLHTDFSLLKEPHDVFQQRVERLLSEMIEERISEANFNAWRKELNIPPGKAKTSLTYTETITLAGKGVRENLIDTEMLPYLRDVLATTTVRNSMTHPHGREKLGLDTFVEALVTYCRFISRWGRSGI